MRLIVLYKDGQRMECLDDIEQAHFYEDKVITNKLPLNIRVIDFKKEGIASINCQDINADKVVDQMKEIKNLKQQLEEKEKEFNWLHEKTAKLLNQKAIEELEKVKAELVKMGQEYSLNLCGIKLYNFVVDCLDKLKIKGEENG